MLVITSVRNQLGDKFSRPLIIYESRDLISVFHQLIATERVNSKENAMRLSAKAQHLTRLRATSR